MRASGRDQRTQSNPQPVQELLAQFQEQQNNVIGPNPVVELTVVPASGALGTAHKIGIEDGNTPGVDLDTVDFKLPNQGTVHRIAQHAREALGVAANAIITAKANHTLGQIKPAEIQRRVSIAYLLLTASLITLVMTFETLIAQRLWQRLVPGITDQQSIIASLVLTAFIAAAAIGAAHVLHRALPGLIPTYGLYMILGWLGVVTANYVLLSKVLSSVEAETSGGVIKGGGPSNPIPEIPVETPRAILGAAYLLLVMLVTITIIGLHLLKLHKADKLYVDRTMAARKQANDNSVAASDLQGYFIGRLQACLAALEVVNQHGRAVVEAYTAGARSRLSPDLNTRWKEIKFDDGEPDWVQGVKNEIKAAERGVRLTPV